MSDAGYFVPNIFFYCELWLYYRSFGKFIMPKALKRNIVSLFISILHWNIHKNAKKLGTKLPASDITTKYVTSINVVFASANISDHGAHWAFLTSMYTSNMEEKYYWLQYCGIIYEVIIL